MENAKSIKKVSLCQMIKENMTWYALKLLAIEIKEVKVSINIPVKLSINIPW